jgi:tetratricopeptide (TPR) repeat protein
LHWGEAGSAKPLLESSAAILSQFTLPLQRRFWLALNMGWLAAVLGDHDVADKHLRQLIDIRAEAGRASHPFAAMDWAYVAGNLIMQGRYEEAEAFLSTAPKFVDDPADREDRYSQLIPESIARARLEAGDVQGAQQVLSMLSLPSEDSGFFADAIGLRGEVACAAGEPAAGLAYLVRAIGYWSRHRGPNHPALARARSKAGLCALALGERKQAEEFAELARRALLTQPRLSPYYTQPLIHLEGKLRSKPRADDGTAAARRPAAPRRAQRTEAAFVQEHQPHRSTPLSLTPDCAAYRSAEFS